MSNYRRPETVVEGLLTLNSTLRRIASLLEELVTVAQSREVAK